MLQPKKTKFRKQHRGKRAGKATRGNTIAFGSFGLVSTEAGWVSANQIEAARKTMTRYIRKKGKIWIRIFPDKPFTKKPIEVRMGSGKGPVEGWVAVIKPGRVLFEMDGISKEIAHEALILGGHKLSVKTKFLERLKAGE